MEKPGIAAKPHQCVVGRQTALGVFLRKGKSWDIDVFVAHAHRAAVALERTATGIVGISGASELSAFCLEEISNREGACWPAGGKSSSEGVTQFYLAWVDWLQYVVGLEEKLGHSVEAQRLLQLSYDYVRLCLKKQSEGSRNHNAAGCAAYAGILKMNAATLATSQYPFIRQRDSSHGGGAVLSPDEKQPARKRTGKRAAVGSPSPSYVVHAHISGGMEYLSKVIDYLGAVVTRSILEGTVIEVGAASSIWAAVKSWKWLQRSFKVIHLWAEEMGTAREVTHDELGPSEWSMLNARGLCILGNLSQKLAAVRMCKFDGLLDRMPSAISVYEIAVDSYLRAAQIYLTTLSSSDQVTSISAGWKESHVTLAGDGARQVLLAVEQMCDASGDVVPSQTIKRAGTGWFGLGKTLLDRANLGASLDALVRGCRLLERWAKEEVSRAGLGVKVDGTGFQEIFRSAQLDLRLSKLSKVLQDSGQCTLAAAAAARALVFCPELWCVSADGQLESSATPLALVERYLACSLSCYCSTSSKSICSEVVSTYLLGSDDCNGVGRATEHVGRELSTILKILGLPSEAIVWVLFTVCRVYRTQLPVYISKGESYKAREDGDALSACIEGHHLATGAILKICDNRRRESNATEDGAEQVDMWEAQARVLAALFEHDLFLAEVAERKVGGITAEFVADLTGAVRHTISGTSVVSRLVVEAPSSQSVCFPAAAAESGVFACVRAMLLRDLAQGDDDVKCAMSQGLDFFSQAARYPVWVPKRKGLVPSGPFDMASIVAHLKLLETHFTLHGDAMRRARAAEIRAVLADRANSKGGATNLPQDTVTLPGALGSIGTAFQEAGIPALGLIFSVVGKKMSELGSLQNVGAVVLGETNTASAGELEATQVALGVLGALGLAERESGESEAENTLLEARETLSNPNSRCITPVTAAYLECTVGLGLSWIYERSGRLAEAMSEIRQVLKLCHAWASVDGHLCVSDRQVVSLSLAKGASVHDEVSSDHATAVNQGQMEEDVGEESGDIKDAIKDAQEGPDGRGGGGVALSSHWIPVYLDALTRMGRLWRKKGVSSKASGYLRQGCVSSEPLRAARFLRRCLMEEVEIATGMHRFARANRLLQACQGLMHKERLDSVSGEFNLASKCTTCCVPDPPTIPPSRHVSPPEATKGNGLKRGIKKGGAKTKRKSPQAMVLSAQGPCIRCRDVALDTAEMISAEAALLRKQGDFGGAFAACERGVTVIAPLVHASSKPAQFFDSLLLRSVLHEHSPERNGAGSQELGWRALEIQSKLRLEQGRVAYLIGNTTLAEELFLNCANADDVPVLVRATALYRLGRMKLDAGNAVDAIPLLERSETLTRCMGVPKLVRKVRRVLAVALTKRGFDDGGAPESARVDGSWRVAALASLSIGLTHCNQIIHASARQQACTKEKTKIVSEVSAGLQLFEVVSGSYASAGRAISGERKQSDGESSAVSRLTWIFRCLYIMVAFSVSGLTAGRCTGGNFKMCKLLLLIQLCSICAGSYEERS